MSKLLDKIDILKFRIKHSTYFEKVYKYSDRIITDNSILEYELITTFSEKKFISNELYKICNQSDYLKIACKDEEVFNNCRKSLEDIVELSLSLFTFAKKNLYSYVLDFKKFKLKSRNEYKCLVRNQKISEILNEE